MATTPQRYTRSYYNLWRNKFTDILSVSADYRIVLLTSSYTPHVDTDDSYADISAYEVSGTGYTAGGKTLTNLDVAVNGYEFSIDSDDVSWPSSTIPNARYAVLCDYTPSGNSNKKLVCYWDLLQDHSSSDTTFLLVFSSSGILKESAQQV